MQTVLITGCSSGFGLATVRHFLDRDWTVIATMRRLREDVLPQSDRLRALALDVTDRASIERAVAAAGPIDVLVNNAGIGWLNALEGTPMTAARTLFDTNTLGTMAMTQAVLPQMRERRAGVIVNVSSSVTLQSLPLLSVYTASKAAVNAFTESLAFELEPFDVRVRLVLPGRAPETSFGDNARSRMQDGVPAAYAQMAQQVFARMGQASSAITYSGGRGRSGLAGGDRSLLPDASACRRRCRGGRRRTLMRPGGWTTSRGSSPPTASRQKPRPIRSTLRRPSGSGP